MEKNAQSDANARRDRITKVSVKKLASVKCELDSLAGAIEQMTTYLKEHEFEDDLLVDGGSQIDDALSVAFAWIRNCQKQLDDWRIRGKYDPDLIAGASTKLRLTVGRREHKAVPGE